MITANLKIHKIFGGALEHSKKPKTKSKNLRLQINKHLKIKRYIIKYITKDQKKRAMAKNKSSNKNKGLTLQFIPFSEISKLDSVDRIKKLLRIVLSNKVVVLQGRLKVEEETRLIEDTMIMIGNIKGFKGVELAVISQDSEELGKFQKLKFGLAKVLTGAQNSLTIIGPASIVKEMRRDPKKLEMMIR